MITGLAAGGAFGFLVEPVAVGVELVFDVIFVPVDIVLRGEGTGFFPGFTLHFEALDEFVEATMPREGVTELVERLEGKVVVGEAIINSFRRAKGEARGFFKGEFGIIQR